MKDINQATFLEVWSHMVNRVRYRMGGKAPSLDCDSNDIDTIDCSGESRYLIAKATGQAWIIPDGSDNQHGYFEGLSHAGAIHKLSQYSDVQYAADDQSRMFIAFIRPGAESPGAAGHVWIICGGMTYESHGGAGCTSRPWDYHTLKIFASDAYELPVAKPCP